MKFSDGAIIKRHYELCAKMVNKFNIHSKSPPIVTPHSHDNMKFRPVLFKDVKLCSSVNRYQRNGGTDCSVFRLEACVCERYREGWRNTYFRNTFVCSAHNFIYLQHKNLSYRGEYITHCVFISALLCMSDRLIHIPDASDWASKLNVMVH